MKKAKILQPQRFGVYLLTIAVMLAFLFLIITNYNFNTHSTATLKQVKDNYGQATIQQTSALIENQSSLLASVTSKLVNTYFPGSTLSQLAKHNYQAETLFEKNARNVLMSLKAVNNYVTDIFLFTEEGCRHDGVMQMIYGVTADDFSQHWNLGIDTETTIVYPGAQTHTNNTMLDSLNNHLLIIVSVQNATNKPAYFCIVLSENYFTQVFREFSDFAILSYGSEVILNNTTFSEVELISLLTSPDEQVKNVSCIYEVVCSNHLTILYAYDSHSLKAPLRDVSMSTLILDLVLLLLSIACARIFAKRITMPFRAAVENISSYPEKISAPMQDARKYSRMSIREQIFSYLIVIILPVFLVSCFSSIYFYRVFTTRTHCQMIQASFVQTCNEIQHFFDNMNSVATAIIMEDDVQQQSIGTEINWRPADMQFFEGRVNIAIYDRTGNAKYLSDAYSFSGDVLPESEMPSVQSWTVISESEGNYIQFTVPYRNLTSLELIGYLVCRIEPSALIDLYADLYHTTGEAFLVDANDQIVSHKLLSVQNNVAKDQRITQASEHNDLIFTKQILGTPYIFVLCGNTSQLQESQRAFLIDTLYLCLGVLVAAMMLSYILANAISKYFVATCRQFYEYVPDLSNMVKPQPSLIDEVNQINRSFNEMTLRINKLNEAAVNAGKRELQLELDARQRELALLQAQINPHFLSNTFENINYFIRNGEPDKAIKTLNTLSDMFSYAVREKRKFVPLIDEINYVKLYVDIMQIRFPNIFTVSYEISDEFLSYKVPCFFLQPIVENAISHALLPKGTDGHLDISCMATEDKLYILIKDNGIGIDQAKLRTIMERLMTGEESRSIGLYNTHHLLLKTFGEPYGLNISSQKNIGTTVILTLPRNTQ